jgi:hypothetical protein
MFGARTTGDIPPGDRGKKMKAIIGENVNMAGMVEVKGWKPGLLAALMAGGRTLREAMALAEGMGGLEYVYKTHNLVTTAGKQFLARRLSGEETVGLAYLAIGTGSVEPNLSDVKLGAEAIRKTMTECYQGDTFVYSTLFLLKSECSIHIREGGIFGGAAATAVADSGTLVCRFLLDKDNSAGAADLTVQHSMEVK